jgi:hypothetical protein
MTKAQRIIVTIYLIVFALLVFMYRRNHLPMLILQILKIHKYCLGILSFGIVLILTQFGGLIVMTKFNQGVGLAISPQTMKHSS